MGVTMVPFNMMVYLEDQDKYVPDDEVKKGDRVLNISGTELRQRLNEGREIPAWFTYPEVVKELRRSYPPRRSSPRSARDARLPSPRPACWTGFAKHW